MNSSAENLDIIRPELFSDGSAVKAWFTLKNADSVDTEGEIEGLNLGFNTGSDSDEVARNRRLLYRLLNLDPDRVAYGKQVHGTRIRQVSSGGIYPETDGLITRVPGLALAIQVADCAALLMADPEAGAVAAVHAGWRGAAGGIVPEAVGQLKRLGSEPSGILVYVSPCISIENFEVGEEVAEQFPVEFVDRQHYPKAHVDLKAFLKQQLLDAGVPAKQIELDDRCTIEDPVRFYSYRREKQRSGRMMGLIVLEQP